MNKRITPQKAIDRLREIQDDVGLDLEDCHGQMDDLFCEILRQHGYGDAVQIFKDQQKWYA